MVVSEFDALVEDLIKTFGPQLRVATPLGLGKPNQLLNAVYLRVAADEKLSLTLYTALSLSQPEADSDLARRFLKPFAKRHWGEHYPELLYARAARINRLPKNIRVHEFYLQAASALNSGTLQSGYQSINYTHVVARLAEQKPNLVFQLIARSPEGRLSLSCNPDLTRDLADLTRDKGNPVAIIGVVHSELPFLVGEAEVPANFFHRIIDHPSPEPKLFAIPRGSIDDTDHAIGFHSSRLVVDDGTLQIGIGSLSDALVDALLMRQQRNDLYQQLAGATYSGFEKGLHGLSEMVMDGFMQLRRAGVLRRQISDGSYLNGAFFLGSAPFYQWLRDLKGEDHAGLRMGRISQINHLYDIEPHSRRHDRKNARFFNTCMQMTVLGGAASETLEDGRVVSGVGGQYNFVAMAHELPDARSILMLRSVRCSAGVRRSNIIWSHGHLTIPRHLRDMVVTEYGTADVRGKTDEETILAILAIADSEFQAGLLAKAKACGKVSKACELPEAARHNTPEKVSQWIARGRALGAFTKYPWGSDFTVEEARLAEALEKLKREPRPLLWLRRSLGIRAAPFAAELMRMNLDKPKTWKDWISKRVLVAALFLGNWRDG